MNPQIEFQEWAGEDQELPASGAWVSAFETGDTGSGSEPTGECSWFPGLKPTHMRVPVSLQSVEGTRNTKDREIESMEGSRSKCRHSDGVDSHLPYTSCEDSRRRHIVRGLKGGHRRVWPSQDHPAGHPHRVLRQSPSLYTAPPLRLHIDTRTSSQGTAAAAENKIEGLIPRVVALEEHFGSCPGDVEEQRRREELILYATTPPLSQVLTFL